MSISFLDALQQKEMQILNFFDQDKRVVCYGAGKIARKLLLFLGRHGRVPDAFCVTKKSNESVLQEKGIQVPIYEAGELPFKRNDICFIASVGLDNEDNICTCIKKYFGDVPILRLSIEVDGIKGDLNYISRVFRRMEKYKAGPVVSSAEHISFPEFHIPNFFSIPDFMVGLTCAEDLCQFYFPPYEEGPYELEGKMVVKAGDIVLDCGANLGIFSAFSAGKGATVYSFEPAPETFQYLKMTEKVYPQRIVSKQVALSDAVGETKMNMSRFFGCDSLLEKQWDEVDKRGSICVQVDTVDNFVIKTKLQHVDFIKADIEGSERDMLAGARETLRCFAPKLAICTYHLPDDPQVLESIILEANPRYHIEHNWKKLYAWVE